MFPPLKERLSDALPRMGSERALERQQLQRSLLQSAEPNAAGYNCALAALQSAEIFDSTLLWLGWRLRPEDDPELMLRSLDEPSANRKGPVARRTNRDTGVRGRRFDKRPPYPLPIGTA